MQQFVFKIFHYGFIILSAIVIAAIATTIPFFKQLLFEIAKTVVRLHDRWMTYNHSLFSWLASATFLCLLGFGGFLLFFCFLVIYIERWLKPQWLPDQSSYVSGLKITNLWENFVLLAFAITLLAQAFETLRLI